MKWLLFALLIFLGACSSKDKSSENLTPKKALGWTSAGLSVDASDAAAIGTGIESVTSVGEYLFARNDRVLDGERRYQLFIGKVGSLLWKELELPGGDVPNVLFADSGMLFVGTYWSHGGAHLWKFNPQTETWTEFLLPEVSKAYPISDTAYGIDGIAKFQGRLVLSLSHGKMGERNPIYFEQPDGSWKIFNEGFPAEESFMRAVEWNGSLFAMTYGNGIVRFDTSCTKWKALSAPQLVCENGTWNASSTLARDAVQNENGLLVGYANLEGFFGLSEAETWTPKVDCSLLLQNEDVQLLSRSPASVYRILPFQNRLIALGEGSAIYSPKENRWNALPPIPGVAEILDGVLVKDTLYVAAFQKGVMKLPTSSLDSLLQNQTVLSEVFE